jgi:hypothetical protein
MSIIPASKVYSDSGRVTPILSLKEYLSEERQLVIPPWQREYTWSTGDTSEGEGEVQLLLTDFEEFLKSDETEYLLGVVTLSRTEERNDPGTLYIVDGQQRTVTLLIFFMCCLEFLIRENKNRFPHELTEFINDLKKMIGLDRAHSAEMRVTFSYKEANTILQTLHTWAISGILDIEKKNQIISVEKAKNPTEEKLLEVRQYITERLEDKENGFCKGKLVASLKRLIDSVKIIELTLDNHDEALEIYDRMNDRGRKLSAADLIKNRLFMETDNLEFGQVSTHWNEMIETLQGNGKAKISDPVFLVRSHASMYWGKTHKENALATVYKNLYFDKSKERAPLVFASELANLAKKGSEAYKGEKEESLFAAQYLGVSQHFPLILAGTYIHNEALRTHFYDQVGTRAALASFSKEFPPQLEHIFPRWAKKVSIAAREDKITTKADLDSIYKECAFKKSDDSSESDVGKYISERLDGLAVQLNEWRYTTGSQKRKIRAALALMSWWMDKKLGAGNGYTVKNYYASTGGNVWEMDHVGATAWESAISDELDKDSIGNLVLLDPRDNRGAQATSPVSKREVYTHSNLLLTKRLASEKLIDRWQRGLSTIESTCELEALEWDLEKWDVQAVKDRQSYYEGLLKGILFRKIQL